MAVGMHSLFLIKCEDSSWFLVHDHNYCNFIDMKCHVIKTLNEVVLHISIIIVTKYLKFSSPGMLCLLLLASI